MTQLRLAALLLSLGSFATGCVVSDDNGDDATLRVTNESDFVIEELRVVSSFSGSWGPNLLGGDVLFPEESITLGLDCGTYDAQLIDEDNVTCEIFDLDLCFDDAEWVIRNNTCTVFGVAKAAREVAAKAAAAKVSSSAAPATL
ncbi:MAG: hypothetical protein H7138_19420 [Myxococcales bacterium]|nr:hypothetical protein [Myxococcales bacterium]